MIVTDLSNSFNPVPKTASKPVSKTVLKQKSKKLAKIERQRDKGLVKSGQCEYCGKYSNRLDPHEIYGGSNRKRSIKHKFVKLICPQCHKDEEIIKQLRINTQREFEKTHRKEEFIKLIGKSYL